MNIAAIRFTAIEATAEECAGCLLDGELSTECPKAWALAMERGLPMCEDRAPNGKQYVYVLDESDPRQMTLPEVMPC